MIGKKNWKRYFLGSLEPPKEAGSPLLFLKSFLPDFLYEFFLKWFGGHLGVKKRFMKKAFSWAKSFKTTKIVLENVSKKIVLVTSYSSFWNMCIFRKWVFFSLWVQVLSTKHNITWYIDQSVRTKELQCKNRTKFKSKTVPQQREQVLSSQIMFIFHNWLFFCLWVPEPFTKYSKIKCIA